MLLIQFSLLATPAVDNVPQPNEGSGISPVINAATGLATSHQPGLLENVQMSGQVRLRPANGLDQLGNVVHLCTFRLVRQQLKDAQSRRITQSFEDVGLLLHRTSLLQLPYMQKHAYTRQGFGKNAFSFFV